MNPNIIPIQKQFEECGLLKASVKGVSAQLIVIDTDLGVVNASTAFSCLVAPMVGDIVLVNRAINDYHILAVLERPAEQDMTLSFPASVKLQVADGKLDLMATDSISLMSCTETNLLSKKLSLISGDIDISTSKLTSRVNEIESHSKSIKLYTDILNTVAKQIAQKTKNLVRIVDGVETLSIGNLIQKVRNNYTSHSKQVVFTASKDIRMDAERIHMG